MKPQRKSSNPADQFRRLDANALRERMLPMRTVAMLVWTLAVTGLGYALVNNAIFYRARIDD